MPTVNVDTSSDGTVLAAAPGAGKKIRVFGLDLTSNGAVVTTLKSNNADVKWTTLATNGSSGGGIVIAPTPLLEIDCAENAPLNLGLSAAVRVAGSVTYGVVPVAS